MMYIFKYAIKSIQGSPVRNLLIGFVVFIVALASLISLTIGNAADEIVKMQEDQFEVTANLSVDRNLLRSTFADSNENMRALMAMVEQLTLEDILYYTDSSYVRDLAYNMRIQLNIDNIVPVGEEAMPEESAVVEEEVESKSGSSRGQFNIAGYTAAEGIDEFMVGDFQMVTGSVYDLFTGSNLALISDELAEHNNLTIGNNIDVNGRLLQVVGVYQDTRELSVNTWFSAAANQLITNYSTAELIGAELPLLEDGTQQVAEIRHTIYLHDGSLIGEYRQELTDKGLDSFYVLRSNFSEFERVMQPFYNLVKFSAIFLGVVLVVGALIMLTINMINIRERKYEIGVLRAMGMKKYKVASQFLAELMLVALVAMLIGITVGGVMAQPVGEYILASELEQMRAEQVAVQENLTAPSGSGRNNQQLSSQALEIDLTTEIQTKVDGLVILQIMILGMLIVMLGSLISLITISRYEPLKILSSRT